MKKFIMGAVASLIVMGAVAFKVAYEPQRATAEVQQIDGYYIFFQCKPVKEYTLLGAVKGSAVVWSNDPQTLFKNMMNQTKRDHPKADAIIFHDVDMRNADAIIFK